MFAGSTPPKKQLHYLSTFYMFHVIQHFASWNAYSAKATVNDDVGVSLKSHCKILHSMNDTSVLVKFGNRTPSNKKAIFSVIISPRPQVL